MTLCKIRNDEREAGKSGAVEQLDVIQGLLRWDGLQIGWCRTEFQISLSHVNGPAPLAVERFELSVVHHATTISLL